MSEPSVPRAFDRRGFLQLLAGAVTALPAVAAAQAPPAPATTTSAVPSPPATTSAAPSPPATPAATPPEHTGGESRLLTEVLRARYPERFTEAQWTSVVGDFDGDLGAAKRLRTTKLANGDEPDSTFRP